MIKREIPSPVPKAQAAVPVLLGVLTLIISLPITLGSAAAAVALGYVREAQPLMVQSLVGAFLGAGFSEEIAKFLMILLSLAIFKKKIRSVYEYVLIGAGVGFGFTIFEEFLYGSDISVMLFRLIVITLHMMFSMIMAYYLGMAKYKKLKDEGSAAPCYIKALLIPIVWHTLYDALTGVNAALRSEDDTTLAIGVVISLLVTALMFVFQIIFFIRFKKDTARLCGMRFIDNADAGIEGAETPDAEVSDAEVSDAGVAVGEAAAEDAKEQ